MRLAPYQFQQCILTPFQMGPMANNTYVLTDLDKKICAVIDPSFAFDDVLTAIQGEGWTLQQIWLTHAHWDHLTGAPTAKRAAPEVKIAMHPEDEIIRSRGGAALLTSVSPLKNIPHPDILVKDGMTLSIGNYSFQVIHTPGHSPGSVCYYSADAKWLFTGDLVFYHDHGRTDLIGGDEKTILRSIREKVMTLPENTIIFPGHEDFTTIQQEKPFYA